MSLGSVPLCGQTVDVHTHIILPEYVEVLRAHGAELEETFPLPEWDAGRHIAFMDSADIRTAVLTMPAPQPYYGTGSSSALPCLCPMWTPPSGKPFTRSIPCERTA